MRTPYTRSWLIWTLGIPRVSWPQTLTFKRETAHEAKRSQKSCHLKMPSRSPENNRVTIVC